MVEQVSQSAVEVGGTCADPAVASMRGLVGESVGGGVDLGVDDLSHDPAGGVIRWGVVDLLDCPDGEDDVQRVLAGEHAESLVDRWWADPGAAQRDWDADLAALYAQVDADAAAEAVARRAALDGAPGLEGFAALLEVLDGAPAWTAEQAATEGFVDEPADGAISVFAASHRLTNHLLWLQTRAAQQVTAAWTGRTPSLPRKTRSGRLLMDDQDVLVDGAVAVELACAAGITRSRADYLVEAGAALVIDHRLPLTAQVLAQGRLDWPRLRLILTRTRGLTADAAQAVEALVHQTRGVLEGGTGRFEKALTNAVLAVDAEAEAKRQKRNRKSRRVSIQTTEDGAALFTAVGPGEAITAAYNGLDAAARYLRQQGDPRTLDQLRHDLLVTGCTSGYLPIPADALPVPAGCIPTGSAAPATGSAAPDTDPGVPETVTSNAGTAGGGTGCGPGGGPCGPREDDGSDASGGDDQGPVPEWFTTTWPDVQVTVNVTVSAETLMGLVDDPGTLDGYGPIPADAIRDLVKNGVFRCLVVDGQHGTVLGVGKNTFTPGYVASERLKLLVEHAFPTCTAPLCGKAASRCDIDHQTPYARGGATCECNTRPLCRPCHRLKTAGLLVPEQRNDPGDPPGTTTWTTRTGRAYIALPHAPLATAKLSTASLSTASSATGGVAAGASATGASATGESATGPADRRTRRAVDADDPPPF